MTLDTEASRIIGTITAIVSAAIALFVAFGLPLSNVQTDAVTGFVAVLAPLVAAEIIRSKVWSKASVTEITKTLGDNPAAPAVPATPTGAK